MQLVLVRAYQSVFRGNPSREQQEIVLADMAARSGFYKVTSPDVSSDVLRHVEGGRALFGHVFAMLTLTDEDIRAFETAVRHEAAAAEDQHIN